MKTSIILFYAIIIAFGYSCTLTKDYEEANRINSIRSYSDFQETHPNSKYKEEVEKKLYSLYDDKAWNEALTENTVEAYEEYLTRYTEGKYRDGAESRMKKLEYDQRLSVAWAKACYDNTIMAYENFISSFPQAAEVMEARVRIKSIKDDIAWKEAENLNTLESYTKYLSSFPQGDKHQIAQARKRNIEDENIRPIWEKVLEKNTIDGYRDFIYRYSDSWYTTLAFEKIRELEDKKWNAAVKLNTIKGFKDFIKNNPLHPNVLEAEKRIIDLEVDQIFKGDHGSLPPLNKSDYSQSTSSISSIDIFNNTQYVLTIRYSGGESLKVDIPAYKHGKVNLRNGNYRITASVNTPSVSNYAGAEILTGGEYEAEYYIVYGKTQYRKY